MNYKTILLFLLLIVFVVSYDSGDYDSNYDSGYGDGRDVTDDSGDIGDSEDKDPLRHNRLIINCDSRCGFIIGLVCGILVIVPILIVYLIKWIRFIRQRGQPQISQQPVVIFQQNLKNNDLVCPKYNQKQFQRIRQVLLGTPCKFTFTQLQNSYSVDNLIIHMNKQTDYNYNLTMSGADKFGSWTSSGYFRNTDKIQIWMKKQYDDKNKSYQGVKQSNLIYEGCMNDAGNYNGKWYLLGFQKDKKYSGQWSMNYESHKNYEINSNCNQIKTDIQEIIVY